MITFSGFVFNAYKLYPMNEYANDDGCVGRIESDEVHLKTHGFHRNHLGSTQIYRKFAQTKVLILA